ncbi:MAG TPA: heme ABC transporter permease [Woeseiaceae bacterium]|nr:heme ABC transporter permease [Woeseiaceae bacterium]
MWTFLHKLASPPHFYRLAAQLIPWLAVPAVVSIGYGTFAGLFVAPPDYQQGDAFRIIYVHVPAAYLSLLAYVVMAAGSGIGLIWRMKLAHAVAAAAAPLGAWFTFLALATGSIWGRPMWGTWWEWGDPRLTSELVLLFLYIGYIALRGAIDDLSRADRASAVLALVGAVNVPIIHYSVEWWSSLHQGPTLIRAGGPAIEPVMMYPLLAMIFGFSLLFGALLLHRVRSEVLSRERRARWVRELLLPAGETA